MAEPNRRPRGRSSARLRSRIEQLADPEANPHGCHYAAAALAARHRGAHDVAASLTRAARTARHAAEART